MSIFKAYDIRGEYPSQINADRVYNIARAFVTYVGCKHVVVGYDMRESSRVLFHALTKGLTDQGANVTSIGLCTTPMLYYAGREAEAAIMITASHNPHGYNGLKLCREKLLPMSIHTGLQSIKLLAEQKQFMYASKGSIETIDILHEYVDHFKKYLTKQKPMRVILDSGNAMSGLSLPEFFKNTPHELVHLYPELDATFPNHEANPLKFETLRDIQKMVVEKKAAFGIATDGDGDRVIFIDEKGSIVSCDILTAFIAELLLSKRATIGYDLRSSKIVRETILAKKGKAIPTRVGHSFIKQAMRDHKMLFAGELSGHFYYKDTFYAESVLYTTILILNVLSTRKKTLSQLLTPFKKYYQSGEMNFTVVNTDAAIHRVETAFPDAKKTNTDGVTFTSPTWWCNIRTSNTEPLLRLNVEADSEGEMLQRRDEVAKLIAQ